MKHKMSALLFVIIFLVAQFSGGTASAQDASAEQKAKPWIYIMSGTDITGVADAELAGVYREADAALMNQIRDGLSSRNMNAIIVESEKDIASNPVRFVLIVKVEKIELGAKRPFGRTAKVKVNYTLQNKDRHDLIRRSHEETSVQKWQNCIKKISDEASDAMAHDIAKATGQNLPEDKQGQPKQAQSPSAEARLQELENLKAKGLIKEKEYEAKRKEILKEL